LIIIDLDKTSETISKICEYLEKDKASKIEGFSDTKSGRMYKYSIEEVSAEEFFDGQGEY